ncbi:uncharacterized protein LOC124834641 isoform X1 [Vigna umbellata]|uniref:uncharacterized protein LOC124834641 isoform X1 n=1 Tax=Vigna umbellata TaxID=87088 RepID=UPI001F5FC702|nr:uncharacterized protein LOC124834641 isoform X1 [Vigna umbellata]
MNKRKISQTKGTDPKTSEFAFFKKLKKDASDGFHLRPLQKESRQSSKKLESTDYSREKMGEIGSNCENSSRIIEHVSTVRTDSCFSPSVKAWNKSGLYCISNTPKGSQDYSDKFKSQRIFSHEDQHEHGEVFARKRQKLRLSAADALFTDLEKLCSKGLGTDSILILTVLSLYHEYNWNFSGMILFPCSLVGCSLRALKKMYGILAISHSKNPSSDLHSLIKNDFLCQKYEDTHPGKEANGTRYDLPDSRKSDDQFKDQYRIPKTKLLGLESSPYLRDHVLSPSYLRLDGRFNLHSKFPTYDSNNFPPRITEPDCKQSANQSFGVATKGDVIPEPLLNEAANATRHGLHDSRELDVQFAEHHQIPKRKPLELESSSSFNDHFLSPVFLRSFEMIKPHADFQPYPLNFQPLLSMTEARSNFGGTPSFIDKSDVTRGFLSNNQDREIFTSNHFKELGIPEKESIPLMEKDFDYTANATNFPITYMHTKPNMPPELSILGHPEEQTLNNTLDRYHFSPSFSLLDKSQNFSSILDSGFLRYQEVKFGRYVYEDMDTNFNHTALSLSHSKHYFNVQENWKNDTSCDQDMFFSPYKHWVGRTVSSAYHHHPNLETWLPSSLDE